MKRDKNYKRYYEKHGKPCPICLGFGLWAFGRMTAMGLMDAEEGFPTVECPVCKSNINPETEEEE